MFRTFARDFLELMRPFAPLFRRALGWIVIMQIAALFEPYMVKYVIDGIGADGSNFPLLPVAALMLVMLSGFGVIQVAKNRSINRVLIAIDERMSVVCGRKLLQLPLSYHQSVNTGVLVGKVIRGIMKSIDLSALLLYEIGPLIVQTIVTAALLIHFNLQATLIILPVVMLFAFLTARIKLKLAPHRMKRHELDNDADELLGQAITNVMTTQAFAQEEREMRAVEAIRQEFSRRCRWEFGQYDRTDVWRNVLVSIGRVAVVVVCARAVMGNTMTLGSLVFVSVLAEKIFISCYRIGAVFDRMMEAADPVRHMVAILHEQVGIGDPAAPQAVQRFAGDIRLTDVTYRYPRRDDGNGRQHEPALDAVSLNIQPGETIGIVGESGGGKSTLAKLLLRFDDPTGGSVTIDGGDLRAYRLKDLRRQIGYVPQEVEIYNLSIAENIRYGRPDAAHDEIVRAATIASAHDFIANLETGYDTLVGDRGLKLSGGQRQRIGIARAVLLDPPILVFDEATSHVDVVSERKIQRAVETLRRGRTMILIAHRLSTIQNADRIVVLERGQIQEIGTHAELIRHNGIYHRLVQLQTRIDATV